MALPYVGLRACMRSIKKAVHPTEHTALTAIKHIILLPTMPDAHRYFTMTILRVA